ncbi:MAG TPA: murein L,D-transpeptidase catalytic domain family protein, partial [Bacteroidales bacterium]|nr:murein L,D-transpeptidase catalytic domain family protein [Bacteroidales bacterium]
MRHNIFLPFVVFIISVSLQSYNAVSEDPPIRDGFSLSFSYAALHDTTLNHEAFEIAQRGQKILADAGLIKKTNLVTIIDYSLPSTEKRLFVIDLDQYIIIQKSLVAHGKNSGDLHASRFSNRMQSHQSALGFYITGNAYRGGQGYSMLMLGVDTGFNDNAAKRSIVMHGAEYVSYEYIKKYGRAGRSFGCPAIPSNVNQEIID